MNSKYYLLNRINWRCVTVWNECVKEKVIEMTLVEICLKEIVKRMSDFLFAKCQLARIRFFFSSNDTMAHIHGYGKMDCNCMTVESNVILSLLMNCCLLPLTNCQLKMLCPSIRCVFIRRRPKQMSNYSAWIKSRANAQEFRLKIRQVCVCESILMADGSDLIRSAFAALLHIITKNNERERQSAQ